MERSTVGLMESLLKIAGSGFITSLEIGSADLYFASDCLGSPMMALAPNQAHKALIDAISMMSAISFFFMALPFSPEVEMSSSPDNMSQQKLLR